MILPDAENPENSCQGTHGVQDAPGKNISSGQIAIVSGEILLLADVRGSKST